VTRYATKQAADDAGEDDGEEQSDEEMSDIGSISDHDEVLSCLGSMRCSTQLQAAADMEL
jgi:hypothetical protein